MRNVLEWLEATAQRLPDKVAVADADREMTFAELGERSREIGTWLATEGGLAPRGGIALFMEKGCDALAGMLGAVYAGGFYAVIDMRQTNGRIRSICDRLEPAVVLVDAGSEHEAEEAFGGTGARLVRIDGIPERANDGLLAGIRRQATDIDPLYAMFTSGSTGVPKGVVVSHRSVIDFIPVFTETFGIGEEDVLANQAPFDFDVSVKDIYSCLSTGARMEVIPRAWFSEPVLLMDRLADAHVTTLIWAVSALCFVAIMRGLEYRLPTDVNKVMFSGEVMPTKQLRRWMSNLPDAMYVNLYGPTEITCNCTYHVIDSTDDLSLPIPMGRPFPNERVFLLDEEGNEVTEQGVDGEVCVSGTALALGYLGDGARTGEVFVPNPLEGRWPERMYRTGDMARYNGAGELVYVGRRDNQVKHLGHRIELGDIESTATATEGVEQACCLYDGKRHKIRLCYVGTTDPDALSESLRRNLPSYMIPNQIRRLGGMPLTKNGKTDRQAIATSLGIA